MRDGQKRICAILLQTGIDGNQVSKAAMTWAATSVSGPKGEIAAMQQITSNPMLSGHAGGGGDPTRLTRSGRCVLTCSKHATGLFVGRPYRSYFLK
jgi:hypothetical protein